VIATLMHRQRLDLILTQTASQRLELGCDVGLHKAVLPLNRTDFQLKASCVGLTSVRCQQKIAVLRITEKKTCRKEQQK
jgi:hypothetical protein